MYKVNIVSLSLKAELAKRGINNYSENYKYVITDDESLFEDDKINIKFNEANIDEVVDLIKWTVLRDDLLIQVQNEAGIKMVKVRTIDYFEALDNDVFAIIGSIRYDVLDKLYVLEEKLKDQDFFRVSKSFLVNILRIDYIKPMFNYKLELRMMNRDTIEVNRTYVKAFKERINLR